MHVLVVDQCSGSKSVPDGSVVFGLDDLDGRSAAELSNEDDAVGVPARKLYTGRQQQYVGEAVDALRADGHDVDRHFVSAGFGLVDESEHLPPYEVTFADMTDDEIETRAATLEISADVEDLVASASYDVVFLALGSDYYRSLDLPDVLDAASPTIGFVVFNQESIAAEYDDVVSVPARVEQAAELETIVVALKGVYLKRFADNLRNGLAVDSLEDVYEACTTEPTEQRGLSDF